MSQVNDGSRYHDQSPLQAAAPATRSAQKLSEKPAIVKKSNTQSQLASQHRIGASSPLVADHQSSYHNSHVLSGIDQRANEDMDIFHIDNAKVPAEFDVNSKKDIAKNKQVSHDKLIELIQ